MPQLPDGFRDPVWWLWLLAVVLLYIVAALAGCDVLRGHR